MTKTVVEVSGLSRRFDGKQVLNGIDFKAMEGRIHGLVGVNGAGKTTLIKHLLGLLRPQAGTVSVFGLDPVREPVEVLKRIGYLSEQRDLPDWMSIAELMDYTRAYYPGWDDNYARELLATFALDGKRKIKELSKGMRAQVGLVAAVAHRPQLLILDEPSSGLDAVVREDILSAVVQAVSDEGRTVLFSSHLLDEVERMSDHITMINAGSVALDGELDAIRASHQRTSVQFAQAFATAPAIAGALSIEGGGRGWSVIHNGSVETFQAAIAPMGGEVIKSRSATLQEIFIARVGRQHTTARAA